MRKLSLLFLSLVLITMVASPAYGDDSEVDCEDDPSALVAAVMAAPGGATLEIEGRCVGTINLDKDLTLEGDDDAVIDGGGYGPVVTIEAGVTVVLEDLKIQGGSATGSRAIGGIDNWGDLTLRGVTVKGNTADATGFRGFPHNIAVGGVHNEESGSLRLDDSTVRDNSATSTADTPSQSVILAVGGVSNLGSATIVDATVRSNSASGTGEDGADGVNVQVAGGIQSFGPLASLTVNDTTVRGNAAIASHPSATVVVGAFGGISNSLGAMSLTDVKVIANSATNPNRGFGVGCGGIGNDLSFGAPVTVRDSVIRDNQGSGWFAVGGVATIFSDVTIEDTVVNKNKAEAEFYAVGGIDNHPGGTLTLIDGKVSKNEAGEGALFFTGGVSNISDEVFGGAVVVLGTTIKGNTPNDCFEVEGCEG